MNLNRSVDTASKVAGEYFLSNKNDNLVYSIRLINKINEPYTNFDFPYQIILFWYHPGYAYYADTQTLQGGIGLNGNIQYSTWSGGFEGRVVENGNKIIWNDGVVWTKINLPPLQTYNPYTKQVLAEKDQNATEWLYSRYEKAYPYKPGCQGL